MSEASKAALDFREYLKTVPAFTSSATRSEIATASLFWEAGARALLEWARSRAFCAASHLRETVCGVEYVKEQGVVRIADLEAYFAEEKK